MILITQNFLDRQPMSRPATRHEGRFIREIKVVVAVASRECFPCHNSSSVNVGIMTDMQVNSIICPAYQILLTEQSCEQ